MIHPEQNADAPIPFYLDEYTVLNTETNEQFRTTDLISFAKEKRIRSTELRKEGFHKNYKILSVKKYERIFFIFDSKNPYETIIVKGKLLPFCQKKGIQMNLLLETLHSKHLYIYWKLLKIEFREYTIAYAPYLDP